MFKKRYFTEDGTFKTGIFVRDLVVLIIVLLVVFGSVGVVKAGYRGVHLRFGGVTGRVIDEGLYFKLPLIDKVVKMEVRVQKEEVSASAASKDLQDVNSVVALNFRVDTSRVADIYQGVGLSYRERIIDPSIQESVKSATAEFTAEELITKRPLVREEIKKLLREKLGERGLVVDEFNIVNFNFSESFNEAIEAKVTAEQQALQAKNLLEKIKFEAQQKVAEAEGKAQAIRIEAQALASNPAILQLRAIEKWNGIMPQVTGGAVPFVNIK